MRTLTYRLAPFALLVLGCAADNGAFDGSAHADGSTGFPASTTGATPASTSTNTGTGATGGGGRSTGSVMTTDAVSSSGGRSASSGEAIDTDPGVPECACTEIMPCPDNPSAPPEATLGVGCPEIPFVDVFASGDPTAFGVLEQLGAGGAFAPTQGSAYMVMGTGPANALDDPGFDCALGTNFGEVHALGQFLPRPIAPIDVDGDCIINPNLAGTGDCSETIEEQFTGGAFDYVDLRWTLTVPQGASGVEIDYALLISEYPDFVGQVWNDMFIVWLEAENWTGNIAVDGQGNPLAVNTVELDYTDDDGGLPELEGTCMEGHGATGWLTGSGPVTAGEDITMVAALWDSTDAARDAYALVDGFRWVCGACP